MSDQTAKGNILLVDDDKFLADMYSMKFVQRGYTVQACLSVLDAVAALRGGFDPDVVLFDIVMPENDGYAFLKTMNDEHLASHAIRIALTNQSDDEEKDMATKLGAHMYLVKASNLPSEVVNIVEEELARRHTA